MRWHVQAEGDAPEGAHRDLADRLGELLGQAEFGTDASHFSGDQVNGPVHDAVPADEVPEDADDADPEPGTGEATATA